MTYRKHTASWCELENQGGGRVKKQTWIMSWYLVGVLIIGVVGGAVDSNNRFHQKNTNRLDSDVAAFANILAKAQADMKESTSNPTTSLEKAYEVNVKVDVGQLNVLWANMYPELVAQGLSVQDAQQIENGLNIVDTNILPPRASSVDIKTIQRAKAWITFCYEAMYPDNKAPQSNAVYFSRLKSQLSSIATKYRSYKSDPNFQVQ